MRKGSKDKLWSLLRKLAIVVLLATAVLLGWETGYLSGLVSRFGAGEHPAAVGAAPAVSVKPAGSAQPLAAMVCSADGGHYGAAYDQETVMAVFHRFSVDLGEALGSAGIPEPILRETFRDHLGSCGVLLRFYSPQPLELLSAWLGAEMSGEAAQYHAELLCLCTEGNGVTLYFRTETGAFFRCTTAVPREGLAARTANYMPNGAYYAFENPLLAGCDDYSIILDGAVSAALVQSAVPLPSGADTDELLRAVGMNSYAASSYTEADGTVVFVNDENTLRLSPSGELFFHRSVPSGDTAAPRITDAVNAAWSLAEQSISGTCGDAALLLADVRSNEAQQSVIVVLDYAVNGIPVRLPSGHAAEITVRDGKVIQAWLAFRRYTLLEERETLLPGLQAAAVAAREGATAQLLYADGGETMSCIWVGSNG